MHNSHRQHIICTCLALLGAFNSTLVFAADGERHISMQQNVANTELIRISVPAGDMEVVGITGDSLTAEVTAVCQEKDRQACYKLLKELDWAKKNGSTTELLLTPESITSFNHVTLKIKIGVPQDKKLEVSLSAGELNISGTSACLVADVSAGEINISLKENQLASAALSAKVGDAKLTTTKGETIAGERSLLVGAKLDWKGTGDCHTQANVLTGQANLVLK